METFVTIVWILLLGALPGLATLALFTIADHLKDIAEVLRNPSWHLEVHEPIVYEKENDDQA